MRELWISFERSILFDWFESWSKLELAFVSTTLPACAKHGFSWITNSGIWFAFNSERMTSKKMREISAMSGAARMIRKNQWVRHVRKKGKITFNDWCKWIWTLTGRCGWWIGFRWCGIVWSIFGMWFRYCFRSIDQQFLGKLLQRMVGDLSDKLQDIFIRCNLFSGIIFGDNIALASQLINCVNVRKCHSLNVCPQFDWLLMYSKWNELTRWWCCFAGNVLRIRI